MPPMTQPAAPKILRVGVLQGRQILEDKLYRTPTTISIGESPKATIMVIGEQENQYPQKYNLFQHDGRGYSLSFKTGMKGKVRVKDGEQSLADLVKNRLAAQQGDSYRVPLGADAKGQVTIGDVTVLFNFVQAPPLPPKAQLPASLRGGFLKNIDWFFLQVFAGVFVASAAFFAAAVTAPRPDLAVEADKIVERFADMIKPEDVKPIEPPKMPEVEGPATPVAGKAEPKPAEPEPEEEPASREPRTAADARAQQLRAAEQRALLLAQAAARVQNTGIVAVLTGVGPGASNDAAFVDQIRSGMATEGMQEALKNVNRITTQGQGVDVGRRASSGPETRAIARDGVAGSQETGPAQRAERVTGRVGTGGGPKIEAGTLDAAMLKKFIAGKQGQIQDCYEVGLREDPRLAGRVELSVTIGENGGMKAVSVASSSLKSPSVEECIVSRVKRWRLPTKPEGGEVDFSLPFVFEKAS